MKYTQKQIDKLLGKWQKILRLQDWKITVVFRRDRDMDNAVGRSRYRQKTKDGVILIVSPEDAMLDSYYPDDYDTELTLVHELLHLHFAPFYVSEDNEDPSTVMTNIAQEAAIDIIAQSLVKLDRGRRS